MSGGERMKQAEVRKCDCSSKVHVANNLTLGFNVEAHV